VTNRLVLSNGKCTHFAPKATECVLFNHKRTGLLVAEGF
jgi:hypothetical protein